MPTGTPVNRQWVVVLQDGSVVIEWGEGEFQDALGGELIHGKSSQISHHATTEDLERLKRAGRVEEFNDRIVYFQGLPEVPRKALD
jgi:hypothetical protein